MTARAPLGIAVLAALEAGGRTDREIAEAVGCDRSYVTILRLQTGAARTPGKPGPAPRIDARRLDAMLAAGISQARAARYLGVTGPAISMHLRRRKRAGEVSPASPSIPDTPHKHSAPISETELSSLHSSQVTP